MKDLYIIDGYNIIFAWKDLQTLADESLEHARQRLIDTIAGYGKIKGVEAVIVFDAMYTDEGAKEESDGGQSYRTPCVRAATGTTQPFCRHLGRNRATADSR